MPFKFVLTVLLLLSFGCSGSGEASQCAGLIVEECMQPAGLVVDTAWLAERLGDANVQLIDTRLSGYDESRIPGAIHLLPSELATTRDDIPDQVKLPADAEPELRSAGLRNDVIAVVYGEGPEYDPARVVWSLSYYRHGDVRYLDGGFAAWVDEGGALETGPAVVEPSDYTIAGVVDGLRVTGDWVLSELGDSPYDMAAIQLVDARSEGEYGSGHIPTAISVDWMRNLDTGFLRSQSELGMFYEGLDPAKTTITYCTSGRRGAFAWLTLTTLGYDDVRVYDGSWNEWGNGEFPVEQ